MKDKLKTGDALVVVDVQNDFCPGGALAVEDGDTVVPVLNGWIEAAQATGIPVVASRDWHPEDHCSFADRDGPWPRHCVRETPGAAFHPELALPHDAIIVSKGRDRERENYSAFDDTGLADRLHGLGVHRLFIGGLAQDVCVKATVIDACDAGFEAHLIRNATRAVDVSPGDGDRALEAMRAAGARVDDAA